MIKLHRCEKCLNSDKKNVMLSMLAKVLRQKEQTLVKFPCFVVGPLISISVQVYHAQAPINERSNAHYIDIFGTNIFLYSVRSICIHYIFCLKNNSHFYFVRNITEKCKEFSYLQIRQKAITTPSFRNRKKFWRSKWILIKQIEWDIQKITEIKKLIWFL